MKQTIKLGLAAAALIGVWGTASAQITDVELVNPAESPYVIDPRGVIDGPLDLCGETVIPIPLFHGPMPVLGFRAGRFAYCTDCSVIPEASFELALSHTEPLTERTL
jgi:hypothetical protein